MERRLAAILAADVEGYSRLMGADEAGTLQRLKALRKGLVQPKIIEHKGRIVKLMGDGLLAEFPSVVEAVQCAVNIQIGMAASEPGLPEHQRIRLRIGVHLGDVIVEGSDIYGDGVNVAARLEGLAEPGGICISGPAFDTVDGKLDYSLENIGERQVKNIAKPVRVYRWPATQETRDRVPAKLRRDPTIAVLPFENLSSDSELGFLCEGIAVEIITALGSIPQLTVVSNDPSLVAKTNFRQADDMIEQQTARYLLKGSVRQAGKRIRVSGQLVDNLSGVQCWAQRYERDAEDTFDLQDDIARNIVIALQTQLGAGSYTNRWQVGTNSYEAWQLQAKGFHEFQKYSPDSMVKSAALWEAALAIDPDYMAARLASAYCYALMAMWQAPGTAAESIGKAQDAFEVAVAADPRDARAYSVKRVIEGAKGEYSSAIAAGQTGVDLEPSEPASRASLAMALMCADQPAAALVHLAKAIQGIPNYPGWFALIKIQCLYMTGKLTDALREAEDIMERSADFYPGPVLAAALHADLGRLDDAVRTSEKVLQMDPQFSADRFVKSQGLKSAKHRATLLAALHKAGLPD